MIKPILNVATALLVIGYAIHALNYYIIGNENLCDAMILFGIAMIYLFV